MNTYMAELQKVDTFQNQNPTLAHQRRALGQNGRLSEPDAPSNFIGETIHNAGMSFLDRIHKEIDDAQPQWVKEARQKELDELAGKVEDDSPYTPPPLTAEQLPQE